MSQDQTPQAPATTAGALGLPTPAKRVDCFGKQGVYVWQKAMHVACDLPEPVRYSLGVLALYMDPDGTSGRPGFARFMLARRKADKTVRRHIEQAIAAGWLICDLRGGRDGQGVTRASSYSGALPLPVFEHLDDLLTPAWGRGPWSQEVTHERPEENSSTGHPGRPVEAGLQTPQPVISTPQPVISAASTGHPGRPTTSPSHRSSSPLSSPAEPQPAASAQSEREKSRPQESEDGRRVAEAYVQERRSNHLPTGESAVANVQRDAEQLLAEGLPVDWLSDRAREMARKGWSRLREHCERSTVPVSRPAAAKAPCEQCRGAGSVTDDNDVTTWCPSCKPGGRPTIHPYQPGRQRSEEVLAGAVLTQITRRMEAQPR